MNEICLKLYNYGRGISCFPLTSEICVDKIYSNIKEICLILGTQMSLYRLTSDSLIIHVSVKSNF